MIPWFPLISLTLPDQGKRPHKYFIILQKKSKHLLSLSLFQIFRVLSSFELQQLVLFHDLSKVNWQLSLFFPKLYNFKLFLPQAKKYHLFFKIFLDLRYQLSLPKLIESLGLFFLSYKEYRAYLHNPATSLLPSLSPSLSFPKLDDF